MKKLIIIPITLILMIMLGYSAELNPIQDTQLDLSSKFTPDEQVKLTELGLDQDQRVTLTDSVNQVVKVDLNSRRVPLTITPVCYNDVIEKNGTTTRVKRDCTEQELIDKGEELVLSYYKHKIEVSEAKKEGQFEIVEQGDITVGGSN